MFTSRILALSLGCLLFQACSYSAARRIAPSSESSRRQNENPAHDINELHQYKHQDWGKDFDENLPSRELFFQFLGDFFSNFFFEDACRPHDNGTFETIKVFVLFKFFHGFIKPNDKFGGNCCEVIHDMCGANAVCQLDKCSCLSGFEGDAYEGCASNDDSDSTFNSETFVPGLQNEIEEIVEESDGDVFEVKANMTTTESGA